MKTINKICSDPKGPSYRDTELKTTMRVVVMPPLGDRATGETRCLLYCHLIITELVIRRM